MGLFDSIASFTPVDNWIKAGGQALSGNIGGAAKEYVNGLAPGNLVGTALGLNGVSANYSPANISNPISAEQLSGANANVGNSFNQQQSFVNALGHQAPQNLQSAFQMAQTGAQGGGPNPAQAQLAQNTASNTANQAALMAGQRGTSQNSGLMARQIAMQGGANQQQAVGQAATLQAQQQLAQQQLMSQIAQQQLSAQGQATGVLGQQALAGQQNVLGAVGNYQNAQAGATGNANALNASIEQGNAARQQAAIGGGLSAIGSFMSLGGGGAPQEPSMQTDFGGGGGGRGGVKAMAHGGVVNGPRSQMHGHIANYKAGGMISGKAPVQGDSPKNDNVQAMLSPGEVVIPRSVMQAKDPGKAAAKFVAALLARKGK